MQTAASLVKGSKQSSAEDFNMQYASPQLHAFFLCTSCHRQKYHLVYENPWLRITGVDHQGFIDR